MNNNFVGKQNNSQFGDTSDNFNMSVYKTGGVVSSSGYKAPNHFRHQTAPSQGPVIFSTSSMLGSVRIDSDLPKPVNYKEFILPEGVEML